MTNSDVFFITNRKKSQKFNEPFFWMRNNGLRIGKYNNKGVVYSYKKYDAISISNIQKIYCSLTISAKIEMKNMS